MESPAAFVADFYKDVVEQAQVLGPGSRNEAPRVPIEPRIRSAGTQDHGHQNEEKWFVHAISREGAGDPR